MEKTEQLNEISSELVNVFTHGIGILFCIATIPILSAIGANTGNVPGIIGATIYAFSLLMVFTSSTLYHSMRNPYVKKILHTWDYISIYFLIAGTYTPFLLVYMFDAFGIALLSVQWSLVLMGIIFKLFITKRKEILSTIVYIIMGWLLLAGGRKFFITLPPPVLVMLCIGGGLYTAGTFFFLIKKIPNHHAVWHLFVLCAAICHYVAVLLAVILSKDLV